MRECLDACRLGTGTALPVPMKANIRPHKELEEGQLKVPIKTGMQPAMMVSLRRRVLAESPGMDRQKVELRMRSMMLLSTPPQLSAPDFKRAGLKCTTPWATPTVVTL